MEDREYLDEGFDILLFIEESSKKRSYNSKCDYGDTRYQTRVRSPTLQSHFQRKTNCSQRRYFDDLKFQFELSSRQEWHHQQDREGGERTMQA